MIKIKEFTDIWKLLLITGLVLFVIIIIVQWRKNDKLKGQVGRCEKEIKRLTEINDRLSAAQKKIVNHIKKLKGRKYGEDVLRRYGQ